LWEGSDQSLLRKRTRKAAVKAKQCLGVICGRTPKVVSPTIPRVVEPSAALSTETPRPVRSADDWPGLQRYDRPRTLDEDPVNGAEQDPDIGSGVGM
jgi:hypothetical protein